MSNGFNDENDNYKMKITFAVNETGCFTRS